jgi:sugar O-acyltransferase (sialic acid O-acetyltransferase NeuD family)
VEIEHKCITIIGASGHGKVCADIARLNGYEKIQFLDDDPAVTHCGEYEVIGNTDYVPAGDLFVAIGNNEIRKKFCEEYKELLVALIHPSAVIAEGVTLGTGTVVMADAVINPGSVIGDGCIINTASSVDHDNVIGNFTHIAVGAHTAGTVKIGECVWLGIGAIVSNNVNICSGCVIGAGAVVIKDIVEAGTYIGVPAKKMEEKLNKSATKWGGGVKQNAISYSIARVSLDLWRPQHERPLYYRSRWVWQRSRMAC